MRFLSKLLETLGVVLGKSLELAGRVLAFLRSVEIDQPRGVILCLAFQVLVLIVLPLVVGGRIAPVQSSARPEVLTPPSVVESVEKQ